MNKASYFVTPTFSTHHPRPSYGGGENFEILITSLGGEGESEKLRK